MRIGGVELECSREIGLGRGAVAETQSQCRAIRVERGIVDLISTGLLVGLVLFVAYVGVFGAGLPGLLAGGGGRGPGPGGPGGGA